jgi:predicted dienelactone hydrolase
MRKAANGENALARAEDVKFALDQITLLNQTAGVLRGKMDLNEIGLAGHSFGALTTMMGVGLKFSDQGSGLADPRIKAAIPMSTPLSQFAKGYEDITVPCLHMTGTEDNSPISETTAEQRRVPYDRMTSAPEYLIIFQGGDHMIFSGRSRLLAKPTDAVFQALIQQTTTAFWDTYLKKSDAAKNWLNQGGAEKALGKSATLEMKKVK